MKVFISYSHEDEALAKKVTAHLQNAGLEVWDDQVEILPGDNWAEKVAQALRESDAMVVMLSPNGLESKWVRREIEYALGEKRYKKRLVPVLVGSPEKLPMDKVPWILKRLNMVAMEDTQRDEDIKQISQTLLKAA